VVTFFVGGSGFGVPNVPTNVPTQPQTGQGPTGLPPDATAGVGDVLSVALAGPTPTQTMPADVSEVLSRIGLELVLGLVLVVLVLWVLFGVLAATMEFVFLQSLRTGDVTVRRYVARYWTEGLRLFGFRTGVVLTALFLFGGIGALLWVGLVGTSLQSLDPGQLVGMLAVILPVVVLVFFCIGLLNGFTTTFVAPIMLTNDESVVGGWVSFWPTLRAQWKQYGVYVLVRFGLTIASGILLLVAIIVATFGFGLLFGALGFGVYVAGGSSLSTPVMIALGVVGLLYLVAIATVWAFVQVPIQTALRYYSLLVLGDTNADLDPIPKVRARLRG
jgi:hypothetical protein